MDKVHFISWLIQILAAVNVTGHIALVGSQDSPAVLTTQKTKAPTKVWTSRSWWNEVPGHNERKFDGTRNKFVAAAKKRLPAKLNHYPTIDSENDNAQTTKGLDDAAIPTASNWFGRNNSSQLSLEGKGNLDEKFSRKEARKQLRQNGKLNSMLLEINKTSSFERNIVYSPDVLYTTTLGPISKSTNSPFLLRKLNEKSMRHKRKANEYRTESLASNTRRNVQRVFASTGRSSNDINLSSFLPKSFANPFQQIEETQGYAYPASNGLTEIDREYFRMIREEAGYTPLFFTNVSTILKHFPIINPEEKFNAEDLYAQEQKINKDVANNENSSIQETSSNTENILVDDTNKAGNDPNKNAISNNNQPLLITAADLLQTSHPVKWANKMVDERMKKDDKNSVKRRGGMRNIGPKWATFNSAKNKTSTEVESNTFNVKDFRSGQKQTLKKEENSFLSHTTSSPHLYSDNNGRNESVIEYKQGLTGNYNGCHVDGEWKELCKNYTHGKLIPFLNRLFLSRTVINVPSHKQLRKKNDYQINHTHDAHDHHHHDHDGKRTHYNHTLSQQGRTLRNKKRKQQKMNDTSQEAIKSWKKQSQRRKKSRKKTNTTFADKYFGDTSISLDRSRALMAEKDLELIHHKHFKQYPTKQNKEHEIQNKKKSSYASTIEFSTDKYQIPRNRPKFIYHKVSALSANTFPSESIFQRNDAKHSSRMMSMSNDRSNITVEKVKDVVSNTYYPHKINFAIKIGKDGHKSVDNIKASFSDRYLAKSIKRVDMRPKNVVAVSLPEHIISSYKTV